MDWFTNNGAYMTLQHCMANDRLWLGVLFVAVIVNALGYWKIAWDWFKESRILPDTYAKRSLNTLVLIFGLCSLTYLWIPIKMFWPGWRAYILFVLIPLCIFTWRYALAGHKVRSMAHELKRSMDRQTKVERLEREMKELKSLRRNGGGAE